MNRERIDTMMGTIGAWYECDGFDLLCGGKTREAVDARAAIAKCLHQWNQAMTKEQIARVLNVHKTTVDKMLKRKMDKSMRWAVNIGLQCLIEPPELTERKNQWPCGADIPFIG